MRYSVGWYVGPVPDLQLGEVRFFDPMGQEITILKATNPFGVQNAPREAPSSVIDGDNMTKWYDGNAGLQTEGCTTCMQSILMLCIAFFEFQSVLFTAPYLELAASREELVNKAGRFLTYLLVLFSFKGTLGLDVS